MRAPYQALCAGALVALASGGTTVCANPRPEISPSPSSSQARWNAPEAVRQERAWRRAPVVLVTIDGARWQDMFGGANARLTKKDVSAWRDPEELLPNLFALTRSNGAFVGGSDERCGWVTTAGKSHVSLPGYMELLSGRTTRCTSNDCEPTDESTVLDRIMLDGNLRVASISSWPEIARAASDGHSNVDVSAGTIEWMGRRPNLASPLGVLLRDSESASPYPAPSGHYRPDSLTQALALEYIRRRSPDFLHVGFGDTDEFAHRGDYFGYIGALRSIDTFVRELVDTAHPRAVLITADHGRAANFRDHGPGFPESRRSFLFAFGDSIVAEGAACLGRTSLPDIGATILALMHSSPDTDPRAGHPIEALLVTSDASVTAEAAGPT